MVNSIHFSFEDYVFGQGDNFIKLYDAIFSNVYSYL